MQTKDWFVATASGLAALLGGVNTYLNSESQRQIERLKTQIVRIGEERKFAGEIMQRFDAVVADVKSDRTTRISRLEGLMALAGLMQRGEGANDEGVGLDTQGILAVIKAQAASYKSEIVEESKTATGARADTLTAEYMRVDSIGDSASAALARIAPPGIRLAVQSTSAPARATNAFDRTRFDIFWCAGTEQSAEALDTANALLRSRPASSTAAWNVKALTAEKNALPRYSIRGRVISIDRQTEEPAAQAFNRIAGGGFELRMAGKLRTPDIISVFVCPVDTSETRPA